MARQLVWFPSSVLTSQVNDGLMGNEFESFVKKFLRLRQVPQADQSKGTSTISKSPVVPEFWNMANKSRQTAPQIGSAYIEAVNANKNVGRYVNF